MRIDYTNGWYQGDVNSAGEYHGQGELHKGNSSYKGGFCNGQYDGYGELVANDGSKYYGHFINGVLSGKGHYISANYEYQGDFSRGMPNGQGTLKTSQFTYTGQVCEGNMHGYGEVNYTNGTTIRGYFTNGKANGRCTYRCYDYEATGDFKDGKMHGNVDISYRNGSRYSGQMSYGNMEGQGKLTYANGDVYEGCFSGGKPHGNGRLTYRNGQVVQGNFTNGTLPKAETPTMQAQPSSTTSTTTSTYTPPKQTQVSLPGVTATNVPSKFAKEAQKLAEDREAVARYMPIYQSGFERAKACVRAEGGNPYSFCTWGYMIGSWRGGHYTGEKTGSHPYGYGVLVGGEVGHYRGYFKQGLRDGYGVESVNQHRFEGYFASDVRHGYFEHYLDNKVYRLKFVDGKPITNYVEVYQRDGNVDKAIFHGACQYRDGSYVFQEGALFVDDGRLVGKWKDGQLDGTVEKHNQDGTTSTLIYDKGRMLCDLSKLQKVQFAGCSYVGMLQDGKRHGYGEAHYDDGGTYKGSWQNDVPHGNGTVVYANGDTYQGNFDMGNWQGNCKIVWKQSGISFDGYYDSKNNRTKGKLVYADGSWYEGEFGENWCYHGNGKKVFADGSVYDGNWQHGKKHGKGTYSGKDGRYTGDFCNDFYHGNGTMVYANGDTYQGNFDMGNWQGNCKIVWKQSGITFDGYLDSNNNCTKGKLVYADGSWYEGEFGESWCYHGAGKHVAANGVVHEGTWLHGKKHGNFNKYSVGKTHVEPVSCFYQDDMVCYYTQCKLNGRTFSGKFIYHQGKVLGFGQSSYEDYVYYAGWVYDGNYFRGVEKLGRVAYYDGEWIYPYQEGVGIYTNEGGYCNKSNFHKNKAERSKEVVLHPLAFDKICAQPRDTLDWLQQDANRGSRNSAYLLGVLHEFGYLGFSCDQQKAFYWYCKSAAGDFPLAYAALGRCYYDGIGTEINYQKAFENLSLAEKKQSGCKRAPLYLARCYRYGYGTKASHRKAKYYYDCASLTAQEQAEANSF